MRLLGSLLVHAVLGAALFALVSHSSRDATSPPATAIEMVDVTRPMEPATRPMLVASAASAGGGGPSSPKRAARSAKRVAAFEDPRGAITFDVGAAGDGGAGTGQGRGTGTGSGIGFGEGAAIAQPGETLAAPPAPPPPKISKARPARLIFPSRQRDVEDGQLFVMSVTVDRDGFVAGARLVRGFGGRRDEVAQDQIWRFRYDPARDDDGNPIASTLEQRFLVQ